MTDVSLLSVAGMVIAVAVFVLARDCKLTKKRIAELENKIKKILKEE